MRILAVDDDTIILALLCEALKAAGYENVETASGGEEAINKIRRAPTRYDCFLLDIQMPEVDGVELCSRIRAMRGYEKSPVLMITAMSDKSYIDRAFAAGATDYVTKPFDIIELMSRIRIADRLIQEHRLSEEKQVAIDALRDHAVVQKQIALTDEIPLDGVRGAIQKLAFENYLLQLGRSRLFGSAFHAFRIENIAQIHARATAAEFSSVVLDVADVISGAFKTNDFFLSYRGNGVFVALAHGGSGASAEEIADIVNLELSDLELSLQSGARLGIRMKVAPPVQCGIFQAAGSLEPLWKALDGVDTPRVQDGLRGSRAAGIKKRMSQISKTLMQGVSSVQ